MVEMALVLPVFVLLMFGLIEYGWVFLKVSQVNNAARQGVRIAVRPDATQADVQAAVDEVMNHAGLLTTGYRIVITNLNAAARQPVSVEVTLPYSAVSLTGAGLVPMPSQIRETAVMAKEGP